MLWVKPPGREATEEEERALKALRQLASVLGARVFVEESDDVAGAVADVARRHGTTYILMGRPRPPRGVARFRTSLLPRLLEMLPGVDIRLVSDRAQRRAIEQIRVDALERL